MSGFSDGLLGGAKLGAPAYGVTLTNSSILIADLSNQAIRMITRAGDISSTAFVDNEATGVASGEVHCYVCAYFSCCPQAADPESLTKIQTPETKTRVANVAPMGVLQGGAVLLALATIDIFSCTFSRNLAIVNGGAIVASNSGVYGIQQVRMGRRVN